MESLRLLAGAPFHSTPETRANHFLRICDSSIDREHGPNHALHQGDFKQRLVAEHADREREIEHVDVLSPAPRTTKVDHPPIGEFIPDTRAQTDPYIRVPVEVDPRNTAATFGDLRM